MRSISRVLSAVSVIFLTSGCYGPSGIPRAGKAPPVLAVPTQVADVNQSAYRLGPTDKLTVAVLGAPDLAREQIEISGNGTIQMPLIGSVVAGGKTTEEVAAEIEARLGERYLKNPQVTVNVTEMKSSQVTIDGAVVEPGMYPMRSRLSLMQAVALAKGASEDAALNRIAVFRNIDGQRMVAVFDIRTIRSGKIPDPEIFGNDIVVVGSSSISRLFRDVLKTIPAVAIFRPFG